MSILAYIDPGAGTILLQMLVGAGIGIAIFFRQALGRVLGIFRRDNSATPGTADDSASR
jgi:hypothetical protein